MLLWACTPSSLFKGGSQKETTGTVLLPDNPTQSKTPTKDLPADTVPKDTIPVEVIPTDSILADSIPADSILTDSILADSTATQALSDSIEAPVDINRPAHAALKRDTTTMDSLELAIYKYNKVIDDSLRLDSLNRQKKNGIDAPVVFSAKDSLIYEAATGMAHLFGDSHVEYQNMDLQSDKIYMCLDSSLVHATGSRDTTGMLQGTPVFKMGSDTYAGNRTLYHLRCPPPRLLLRYVEG